MKRLSELKKKDLKKFRKRDRKALKQMQRDQQVKAKGKKTLSVADDPVVPLPKATARVGFIPKGLRPKDTMRAFGLNKKARRRIRERWGWD